jgi:hypothetical protein
MPHLTSAESKEQTRAADSFSFHKLKCLLENSFPESFEALRERWYQHVSHQMLKSIAAQHGLSVQSGPFQGMQYSAELLSSKKVIQYAILPKILGCFEAELHGVLAQVVRRNYDKVVNIGCSEGYYSVGLSLRLPDARVFAFDIDPHARQLCERMARLNGVQDRMVVDGECRTEHLQALSGSRTLVICDCEGCELGLLCTDLAPRLSMCDFIVELHDCVDPTISKVVPSRFAHTHDVTILTRIDRDLSVYTSLKGFSPYKQRLAVGEYRWGTPCVWTFMATRYNQQV